MSYRVIGGVLILILLIIGMICFSYLEVPAYTAKSTIEEQPQSRIGGASKSMNQFTDEEMLIAFAGVIAGAGLLIMALAIPSFVCATAARRKGLSGFGFFLLSFCFTPIIGFIAVIAFPPKRPPVIDVEVEEITIDDLDIEEVPPKDESFKLG